MIVNCTNFVKFTKYQFHQENVHFYKITSACAAQRTSTCDNSRQLFAKVLLVVI